MDKFDRILQLHTLLSSRRTAIPLEDLMARLECSRPTLLRAIAALKDMLNAPLLYDSEAGGYRRALEPGHEMFELPGLWFSAKELQALAIMQRLLKDAGGGLLEHLPVPSCFKVWQQHGQHGKFDQAKTANQGLAVKPEAEVAGESVPLQVANGRPVEKS